MEWISVKDRLPNINEDHDPEAFLQIMKTEKYMVTYKNIYDDKHSVDCWLFDMNEGKFLGVFHDSHASVTHWAERPEPATP